MYEDARSRRCIMVVEAAKRAGYSVMGPVPSVEDALEILNGNEAPDAAILDVNLRDVMVYPVADALVARGIPFIFATGCNLGSLPKRYARARCLGKPVETSAVIQEVEHLFDAA